MNVQESAGRAVRGEPWWQVQAMLSGVNEQVLLRGLLSPLESTPVTGVHQRHGRQPVAAAAQPTNGVPEYRAYAKEIL